jgi:DNA-binding transcriptional LysR family regulator
MERMSHFDHLDLDGHLLRLLLAVTEEKSITRAAERLGVTQSAVSHSLDKLRGITGDPLFVKSGRGIVATARAEAMAAQARTLLDAMRSLAAPDGFDPATLDQVLTVAANDLQRELLLPALLRRLRAQAPGLRLRVIASNVPGAAMLREDHCQLVLTPRPPDGDDILQKRLFSDRYRVFHDAGVRAAPVDRDDYLAADHATVIYEPNRPLDIDRWLADRGVQRRFAVVVPGFAALPAFLRGSPLLATLPSLAGEALMNGCTAAPVPFDCPELPMYMVWHRRHQDDAMHRWLRDELHAVCVAIVGQPAAPVSSR